MRTVVVRLVLSMLCAVGPSAAARQATASVSGRVVDGRTGRPIAGAVVSVVEGSGNHSNIGIITGADGRFALAGVNSGTASIRATKPGYIESEFGTLRVRGSGVRGPAAHR